MRRLAKVDPPDVLVQNAAAWREEYLAAVAAGHTPPARYRHPDIKGALFVETQQKCAYCESKYADVTWGDVEHILPKAMWPELVFQWENLTLACSKCNGKKRDYYSDAEPLINPYRHEPMEHLFFAGSLIFGVPGSALGRRAVLRLDLAREPLASAREGRLKGMHLLVSEWAGAEGQDQVALAAAIRVDAERGEFTECVRAFLWLLGFPLDEPESESRLAPIQS